MRFISCHIVGFGKFIDRRFDFAQLHVFKEDNGWGKTTLAAFLECMLYGLDAGRNRDVADNMRLKYEPWSGTRFGGSLSFSYQDKTYRIERFFGKTPVADTVKIYDENNMLSYQFGDKGEWLGEKLFGLDRDSYRKCVYLPQSRDKSGAMTQTIKEKLLALLSVGETGGGAQNAIARLDEAEKALRAKRKPGKGKLDELDDRLALLQERKAEYYRTQESLRELEDEGLALSARREELNGEMDALAKTLEAQSRQQERMAARATYEEMQAKLDETQYSLQTLNAFFGKTQPCEVNVDGLQTAVNEYYDLQGQLQDLQPSMEQLNAQLQAKQALKIQLTASEKNVQTYQLLIDEERKTKQAGKRARKQEAEAKAKKWGGGTWQTVVAVIVAAIGLMLIDVVAVLGYILAAAGGLWLIGSLLRIVRFPKRGERIKISEEVLTRYAEAKAERAELVKQMEQQPKNLRLQMQTLQEEMEKKQGRMGALKTAIENFLQNFAFEKIYDYRAALDELRDKIAAYDKYQNVRQTYAEKVQDMAPLPEENVLSQQEMDRVQARYSALQVEKEDIQKECGRNTAHIEETERRILALQDILQEEPRLNEEKTRLENRLIAIRAAREFLMRARENMAKRYLQPVEEYVAEYRQILGLDGVQKVRFTSDGRPVLEDGGAYRSADFYSEGFYDLLFLCVRLALSKALPCKHTPPLILDDPFVNLDDDKTARAKRLIKSLSKERQILYFTCKSERAL